MDAESKNCVDPLKSDGEVTKTSPVMQCTFLMSFSKSSAYDFMSRFKKVVNFVLE